MSLDGTYAGLQASIGTDWLNRTDLTAQIPDFISLAEAEIKRRLRRSTVVTTIAVAQQNVSLPADCAELRSLRFVTADSIKDLPIQICTMEMLSGFRAGHGTPTGRPMWAAILSLGPTQQQLVFAPAPDIARNLEITYFQRLVPLSASNPSNTTLVEAPDIYLYGALKHALPYLEHDERASEIAPMFEDALEKLNDLRVREEFSASLRPSRLPVVF